MTTAPLKCRWTGDSFAPIGRSLDEANAEFVVGQVYALEEVKARSQAAHNFYFAAIHDAWCNLPESSADRWPSPEHLRKWALIQGGYRDERTIVCTSKAEAERVAAFIRPMDQYAVVTVVAAVVRVFTAQSQSLRAMGKDEFNHSKEVVLGYIAAELGISPEALRENAGKAA
jgi:hypothetical protein